jgi:hypothetical protein
LRAVWVARITRATIVQDRIPLAYKLFVVTMSTCITINVCNVCQALATWQVMLPLLMIQRVIKCIAAAINVYRITSVYHAHMEKQMWLETMLRVPIPSVIYPKINSRLKNNWSLIAYEFERIGRTLVLLILAIQRSAAIVKALTRI